jgi:hypothetical protein
MNMAAWVFELAGFPMSLVYQRTDNVPRGRYLSEIAGILHSGINLLKSYSQISASRKQHVNRSPRTNYFLAFFSPLGVTV